MGAAGSALPQPLLWCMTYRLQVDEPISKGVSRVGLAQIEMALTRLADREDPASAIHDTRRCLKRVRALLRLIRPALPPGVYRREANRLAGIGRLLAEARDQHVMQQTLAKLAERSGKVPAGIGAKINALMANGGGKQTAGSAAQSRKQAVAGLEQARKFFAGIARRNIGFDHVAEGLERSYRRARRAFQDAYEHPADEAFHEWRKAVQQHWRHMQLLSRVWPDVMGGRAAEAKELSRLLGEDHDVFVLLAFAASRGSKALSAEDLAALAASGQSLQADLRQQARPRGKRLFAEKAGELSERVAHYWSAARDLREVAAAREEKSPGRPAPKPMRKAKARRRKAPTRPATGAQAASREPPGPDSGRPGR
jgi:CHAD domain-containing protein